MIERPCEGVRANALNTVFRMIHRDAATVEEEHAHVVLICEFK